MKGGAKLLAGGKRQGNMLPATLLENVPRSTRPVSQGSVRPGRDAGSRSTISTTRIARVNDSDFGLQAGVFTGDLAHALRAWDRLEVGGVIVGDVPSFRVDNMPYGGVKQSGLGREGVRYAIEDMTEPRLLVIRG